MSSFYSGDNTAGDHTHTEITTGNIEEPQQKYLLGMVNKELLVGLNMFNIQTLALCFCSGSKHLVHLKVPNS